jgi:WhiB family redox-sensing transcriptional regulator
MSRYIIRVHGQMPGDWADHAACRLPENAAVRFFPGSGEPHGPAFRVCWACPVQADCLEHALDHEHHGIWAATSERDRMRLRRMRRHLPNLSLVS